MNIMWASRRLMQKKPVRRKSWGAGEYVGNDGRLFYCCAHEETYNSPSVSITYVPALVDMTANDWEPVTVLESHGWVVEPAPGTGYSWQDQEFFWTEAKAIKAKNDKKYGQWIHKRVTKNLFAGPFRKGRYE